MAMILVSVATSTQFSAAPVDLDDLRHSARPRELLLVIVGNAF